ncbi:MAG: hypothetical protein KC933_41275, partial [Myxococcales bacterium]|nr:hypothetical protein [Myxococcales bacterium]
MRLSLPGPEWKVLAGEDAAALCDGAVLAAMSPTATGTVHLRPLEGSLGDHLTALAEGLHLAESAITLGAPETDGAGRPRQVVTLTGKLGDTPLQVTGRAVVQDAVVVEALAWAPSDTPGEALTAFLDALEVTSPPGALPPASPSRQDVGVGEDQSLRKGRYRDFALALELSVPEGWEASLGPAAERLHELARLHLHHAEHQLHLVLLGEPAASDWNTASHHEAVRAGMQARVGLSAASAESRKIGDVDALVSEGQAGARSYRVYTAL